MKKINKKNLTILILNLVSLGAVFYDLFVIITKLSVCWTVFGILSFCFFAIILELSYEYLESKIKDTDINSYEMSVSTLIR